MSALFQSTQEPQYIPRPLFGGAIIGRTVSNLIDASDLRQVPDTQEVFLYSDSDVSIIVEILQRVDPNDDYDAIKFHFDSLAHDNGSHENHINQVSTKSNDGGDDGTPSAILLDGVQNVLKFNQKNPDEVRVLMALYRIAKHGTDIVVTFNLPIRTNRGPLIREEEQTKILSDFREFVHSFQIVDYNLFAQ